MSQFTRRFGAFAAASLLTFAGVAFIDGPANAIPVPPTPAAVGANWLAGQLTSGLMHYPDTGFGAYDDYGLSIDSGLALDELHAIVDHSSDVTAISTALAGAIGNYVTGDAFGDTGSSYAGATAKAAVFADVAGDNPASYGGLDLITRLEARVSSTAPITGRIEDLSSFGDFANTIGQSFAVNALDVATSTKASDALAFLLKQQCSAGYFRLNFTSDKTASDQTCEGGRATGASAPDSDATSTAVRLLLPQIDTPAVARAIGRAESWLLGHQHADGSFGGGVSTSASNANSTGLAGWALGLLGDTAAAGDAAVWVRMHEADELSSCPTGLSSQTGAIGYNDAAVTTGRSAGITAATTDQWRRASAQALAVLQWAPTSAPALALTGPTGYVEAGKAATYHVSGVVPGDTVCITGPGIHVPGAAGIDGTSTIGAIEPAGTATRTITVTDRAATVRSVQTKVLGVARLNVKPAAHRVKRGKGVAVTVSGLAAGEKVSISYRGHVVAAGTATSAGTYVVRVHFGRGLGLKKIVALGQFSDIRSGSTTIRVIR